MTKALSIQDKQKALEAVVKKHTSVFIQALPKHVTGDRFLRIIISAITKGKQSQIEKLANCTQMSFLKAVMQACQLGLEVNSPMAHATIIPYGNVATFMPMYGGLIELMTRSKDVNYVEARVVYENDKITVRYGLAPDIDHVPNIIGDRGKLIGSYAVVWMSNGSKMFEYMTAADIDIVKAKSASAKYPDSPWDTNEAEMWRKSPVKRISKYMPKSADEDLRRFAEAVSIDNCIDRGEQIEISSEIIGNFVVDDDSDKQDIGGGTSKSKKITDKLKKKDTKPEPEKEDKTETNAELEQSRTTVRNNLARCIAKELCEERDWLPAINQADEKQLNQINAEFLNMLEAYKNNKSEDDKKE